MPHNAVSLAVVLSVVFFVAFSVVFLVALPSAGQATALDASLFARSAALAEPEDRAETVSGGASLFSGRRAGGLFAPTAPAGSTRAEIRRPTARPGLTGLRDLIARAEAGSAGYDAVQYGARIRPSRPPTQMTLKEIYAWIEATPGQPHAIGRYQFIPPTLRRLVQKAGIPTGARFSPAVQDSLADILMAEAGLQKFLAGDLKKAAFMHNLAKIWAGFPTATGRSYYHGYAGNKATMTWAEFHGAMRQIFPGQS